MLQTRRASRTDSRTEHVIGSYHTVVFTDVADAVEFCQRMVPHVVPPVGCPEGAREAQAVVWFHMPPREQDAAPICHLYLSHTALEAAERAGFRVRSVESVTRSALPGNSVLVFGEDRLDPPAERSADRRPSRVGRVASKHVELLEADAILR
jgi:hypothetical protein